MWTPGIGGKNTQRHPSRESVGGFYPKIQQVVPALFLVDVDGDGDDDAVGIHNSDAFVFFNNRFTGPSGGIRRQYGPSNPGSLEMTPTLGAVGPFRSGGTVEFRVTGGVGAAPGLIVLGSSEVAQQDFLLPDSPTMWIHGSATRTSTLSGAPGAPGSGNLSVTIPVMPTTVGITAYHQVFLVDWSSPSIVVGTNGLCHHVWRLELVEGVGGGWVGALLRITIEPLLRSHPAQKPRRPTHPHTLAQIARRT